jgi:hypothetical protein
LISGVYKYLLLGAFFSCDYQLDSGSTNIRIGWEKDS